MEGFRHYVAAGSQAWRQDDTRRCSAIVTAAEMSSTGDDQRPASDGEMNGKHDIVREQCKKAVSDAVKQYNEELEALKKCNPSVTGLDSDAAMHGHQWPKLAQSCKILTSGDPPDVSAEHALDRESSCAPSDPEFPRESEDLQVPGRWQ